MNELKPCPKCGSIKVKVDYRWDSLNLAKTYFVYCPCCNICFNGNYSENSTIAKWNHRPTEDALTAEIERLKLEVKRMKIGLRKLWYEVRDRRRRPYIDLSQYYFYFAVEGKIESLLAADNNVLTKESKKENE